MAIRSLLFAVLTPISLLGAGSSAAQEMDGPPECTVRDSNSLEGRNCAFLHAVHGGTDDELTPFFPRSGDLAWLRTSHGREGDVRGVWRFRAEELDRVVRGPLIWVFDIHYEGQTIGTLSHQIGLRGTRWRRVGRTTRFVPADARNRSALFVEWRREGDAWVVSAIGDEDYGAGVPLPSWCC